MNTSVQEAGGAMPEAIVYMPKGERRIFATVNGKAGWSPLKVDREAADVLQRDLETIQAEVAAGKRSRPVLYFDHKTGPAAGLPKRFSWDEEKGVLLELDWTGAGKDAVLNQNYGYFSPTFRVGLETGEVLGLHRDATEVGSLVNRPAIEDIGQIAAARPDGEEQPPAYGVVVEVMAANPYGCNQYGEGWKKPHNGESTSINEDGKKIEKMDLDGGGNDGQMQFDFSNAKEVYHPNSKKLYKGQQAAEEAYERYKDIGDEENYYGLKEVYEAEEKAWKAAVQHPDDDSYYEEAQDATAARKAAVDKLDDENDDENDDNLDTSRLRSAEENAKRERDKRKEEREANRRYSQEKKRKAKEWREYEKRLKETRKIAKERAKQNLPAARAKLEKAREDYRTKSEAYKKKTGKSSFGQTKEGREAAHAVEMANSAVEKYEADIRAAYGEDLSPRGGVAEVEKKPDNGDTAKGGGFTTMDDELKKRLGCDEKADDAAVTAAMIKCMDDRDELQKKLDALKGEKDKVDAELKAAKAEAADAFVNDLKARNVIAPHDEARISAAKAVFEANPAQARALFDGVVLGTSGSVTEGSILAGKPEGAGQTQTTEEPAAAMQKNIMKVMGLE